MNGQTDCRDTDASPRRIFRSLLGVVALLSWGLAAPAWANPAECAEALQSYNTATSEVSSALRSYTGCLSSSQAHDDCSSEFLQLQSAQSDFESAVQAYQFDCS